MAESRASVLQEQIRKGGRAANQHELPLGYPRMSYAQ